MYTIRKEFHFSASHNLEGLCDGHPCSRIHGHNYVVTVELRSCHLNKAGFVRDYRELGHIKRFIDEALDHKHLNDFLPFNPTSENMAKHFYELFKKTTPELVAVEISETPKTHCRYEPFDNPFCKNDDDGAV